MSGQRRHGRSIAMILAALAACACPGKQAPGAGPGTSAGSDRPPPTAAKTCDQLRPKLEALYRAEAEAKEPKRVDEAVADNTAMVLGDCAKEPIRVIPCVNQAASVAEIEARCVRPLDEEGSEGLELK